MNRALVSFAATALVLSGCASDTTYPSLARRPAERPGGVPPVVSPTPLPPSLPSAGMTVRLDGLVDQARAAHARFGERRGRAEQLVAASGRAAMGSEGYAVAIIALAELESARSDAMIALATLDTLYAADRTTHPNEPSGDAIAIASARERVMVWVGEEDRVLARLHGRLSG